MFLSVCETIKLQVKIYVWKLEKDGYSAYDQAIWTIQVDSEYASFTNRVVYNCPTNVMIGQPLIQSIPLRAVQNTHARTETHVRAISLRYVCMYLRTSIYIGCIPGACNWHSKLREHSARSFRSDISYNNPDIIAHELSSLLARTYYELYAHLWLVYILSYMLR